MFSKNFKRSVIIVVLLIAYFSCLVFPEKVLDVRAMPFYDLSPKDLVCRASFSTKYSSSSASRKENVKLAAKSLDNTFVDVGGEFSFNATVGERTEKRGYKTAKIIVDGKFVDGVGGGVCQVSTTLYNAVLLADLNITEFHPHSLAVSYVAPSFDAMVNSGWADLKFINDTHNPLIIKAKADGNLLTIEIYGEPLDTVIQTKSVITGEIPPPIDEEIDDDKGEYPDLYEGDKLYLRYGKAGLTSEGYVITIKNGKTEKIRKIRTDKYNAIRGLVINGKAVREESIIQNEEDSSNDTLDFMKIIRIIRGLINVG